MSVETGMGPDCRRKHGWNDPQGPADQALAARVLARVPAELGLGEPATCRELANKLVHRVALAASGAPIERDHVNACVDALRALGFLKLADKLATRIARVHLEKAGANYVVRVPYNDAFRAALAGIRGRRWDRELKAYIVPGGQRAELWRALCSAFEGESMVVPTGELVVIRRRAA